MNSFVRSLIAAATSAMGNKFSTPSRSVIDVATDAMGNTSSTPSRSVIDVATDAMGNTSSTTTLSIIHRNLITENEKMKEDMENEFPEVRILVVGKSGSGKSTLIRVLIGDDGPRRISVGEQNIIKEWRHPDLPFVIHDSEGNRKADIKKFLDDRLSNAYASTTNFGGRVNAVWYVFSAMDSRVLDDGGLLEMLDGYGKDLPLLLIMTNNDYVEKLGEDDVRVTPKVLYQLLEMVKDPKKRSKLRKSMVRVGNKMKLDDSTGKVMEGSIRDLKGMGEVFKRTKDLMDENLWITWSAGQAVNMEFKILASSELIVRTNKKHVRMSWWVSWMPFAQQVELASVYGSITRGLIKIWNVSENLEKAIVSMFLVDQRWHATTDTVVMSLVGSMSAQIFSYALLVLGTIIYVYVNALDKASEASKSVDDYLDQCHKFVGSDWANSLSEFSRNYSSVWDASVTGRQQQIKRLCPDILNFFKELMMRRPHNLHSQM